MSMLSILRQALFVSPKDLYTPLARFSLSVGESGAKSGHVNFKYSGTYDVLMEFSRECLPYRESEFSTSVRFILKQGDAILFDTTSQLPGNAHRVCQFEIPDSAPMHHPVEYSLGIVNGNSELERVCGPVHFQIVHVSVK